MQHANDNIIKGRTIEPFSHRLFADGLLHKNDAMNAKLFPHRAAVCP